MSGCAHIICCCEEEEPNPCDPEFEPCDCFTLRITFPNTASNYPPATAPIPVPLRGTTHDLLYHDAVNTPAQAASPGPVNFCVWFVLTGTLEFDDEGDPSGTGYIIWLDDSDVRWMIFIQEYSSGVFVDDWAFELTASDHTPQICVTDDVATDWTVTCAD